MRANHSVLVIGSGSIGQRHMRNLRALGVQRIAVCDPKIETLAPMIADLGVQRFTSFDDALSAVQPDLVLVCTPPALHVQQALNAVRSGAHVFVEKPLAATLDGVDALLAEACARKQVIQVGYNLRFQPGLQIVKQLVSDGAIGRILWARFEFGQYLPDWRPSQNYRQSYTASRALGGGIILDASHELDYAIWLLGRVTQVMCMAGKVSDLEVDVEDCATVLLRFASGVAADVHLDFVQRAASRSCKLAGEDGTINWEYQTNEVRIYRAAVGSWEAMPYTFSANDMYLAEMRQFLDCVERATTPLVDLVQAKTVLKVALAAKSSAELGRPEPIDV